MAQNALDASGVARPAATEDGARLRQGLLADEDAEKSAVRARDDRALDAQCLERPLERLGLEQPDAAAVLCRPDAVQSAERSYEAPALRALPAALAATRSAEPVGRMVQPKRQVLVPPAPQVERAEQQARAESLLDAGAAQQWQRVQLEQVSAPQRAFRQPVPPDAQLARVWLVTLQVLAAKVAPAKLPVSRPEAQLPAWARQAGLPASAEAPPRLPSSA